MSSHSSRWRLPSQVTRAGHTFIAGRPQHPEASWTRFPAGTIRPCTTHLAELIVENVTRSAAASPRWTTRMRRLGSNLVRMGFRDARIGPVRDAAQGGSANTSPLKRRLLTPETLKMGTEPAPMRAGIWSSRVRAERKLIVGRWPIGCTEVDDAGSDLAYARA